MSEKETKSNSSNVDDGATKKKYAILYGYCGTGYQGSQTYYLFVNRFIV